MKKIFEVVDACNGCYLYHTATGLSKCIGDGTDQDMYSGFVRAQVGTLSFRQLLEDEANSQAFVYFDAYWHELHLLEIYDSDSECDRYTVITEHASALECRLQDKENLWTCLCLSDNCDSPGGFSQWGYCALPNDRLGERIHFLELPDRVQKHIVERLEEGRDE